jgi:hypothetical protein
LTFSFKSFRSIRRVKASGKLILTSSIEECLAALKVLHGRLQRALAGVGLQAVVLSAHPTEVQFFGPQNKRQYDYWQWAMVAILTYGPTPPQHKVRAFDAAARP